MRIPLQKISDPIIFASGVNLHVLRLDLNHPYISGNKFFKLKYNIQEAKRQNKDTLLTFGGAYSNHIAATAAAGKEYGLKTIGVIRGDELKPSSQSSQQRREKNHTLKFAEECGMKLHFVSREEYRRKDSAQFLNSLPQQFNNFYLLPEGGTNDLAVKGCSEILSLIDIPFDYVCCPVGTGGTISGVISSLKENQKAIGFSVLKANGYLENEVRTLLLNQHIGKLSNWHINQDYHFSGYAKHTPELLSYIDNFEKQNNIPLEHVYTGKMMFGIYDLIQQKFFAKNCNIIAIHTGGLQGKLAPLDPALKGD